MNSVNFNEAVDIIGREPDIDSFATRINYKCDKYVSYQPDPGAFAIDSFHISWEKYFFLCFFPILYNPESPGENQ